MDILFRCDPALVDILPRPVLARDALPDWLRQMPAKAFSEMHQREVRTVKQCPPFVDAMRHGFMILLPCDVLVERGVFSWNWSLPSLAVTHHPRAPLSFHVPEQLRGAAFHDGTSVALKFNSFWTIALPTGWSLYATHPVNRDDLPFRLLTGVVDADRFSVVGIHFPAMWTQPDFQGVLPKGTPIAQCFAVPRDLPELHFETLSAQQQSEYDATVQAVQAAPGIYRKKYRSKRKAAPA